MYGQTSISPLAVQLATRGASSPWEALGNLAMVAATEYRGRKDTQSQAEALAKLLAGSPGGMTPGALDAAATGGGYSGPKGTAANPQYDELVDLIANNPGMAGAFGQAALQKRFPQWFGEQRDPQKVWDPQSGQYVWGHPEVGTPAEPAGGGWQNAGDGKLWRQVGNEIEWRTVPGAGGGGEAKPPTVQTFYDEATGREYKAQWDAKAGQWVPVGGAKADPVSAADVMGPIYAKLARGEELTAGEQSALDQYRRTSEMDQFFRDAETNAAAPPSSLPEWATGAEKAILDEAKAALAQGAPRAAVEQRLRERGIDPAKLGQ
ncbi:MAG: hypothetical protein AB7P12_17065 [Alphaproteobacteria bacterium]